MSALTVMGFSLFVAALMVLLLRFKAPAWVFATILILAVGLVETNGAWRVYSFHGFMHSSIVYGVFERGWPIENPLFAGAPLKYPAILHAFFGLFLHFVSLTPPWLFAALNILCLAAAAFILDRIARLLRPQILFRVYTVFFALMGTHIFRRFPMRDFLGKLSPIVEGRSGPIHKFLAVNVNQVGWVFYLMAFLGLMQLYTPELRSGANRSIILLGLSVAGSALIYPLAWPGILAVGFSVALTFLFKPCHSHDRESSWLVLLCMAATSLPVLPYLFSIASGKKNTMAHIRITVTAHQLLNLGLAFIVPLMIVLLSRKTFSLEVRSHPALMRILIFGTTVPAFLFLVVTVPNHSEYKFLLEAMPALGVLLALSVSEMFNSHRAIAAGLTFLILLPFSSLWLQRVFGTWPVVQPVVSKGRNLLPKNSREQTLVLWILEHTPKNSVFLDENLTIPVFAHRPLYIGLDENHRTRWTHHIRDGWGISARVFNEMVNGLGHERVLHRIRLVRHVLYGSSPDAVHKAARAILQELPGRPVYALVRHLHHQAITKATRGFRLVFRNDAGTIFRIRPSNEPKSLSTHSHRTPFVR